ncbi:hypothetical protein Taro_043601, partial [Colocasia esculenta]|nr:hypothetical protein [Colocasia esculenta]
NSVAGDATNIFLDPILMFTFHLGISGAAIAHVISQYLISLILLWRLTREVDVLPPRIGDMQFSRFLRNGILLLARVIAVTFCVTLAASMAARLGSTPMAAFQICLQIWLTTSLLADGLAVAGQAILASAFARKDHHKATAAAIRVLQLGAVLGLGLVVMLGFGLQFASRLFTSDPTVLKLIYISIPFVALTQPLNVLAFVFDGINFGASDFKYAAYSMSLDINRVISSSASSASTPTNAGAFTMPLAGPSTSSDIRDAVREEISHFEAQFVARFQSQMPKIEECITQTITTFLSQVGILPHGAPSTTAQPPHVSLLGLGPNEPPLRVEGKNHRRCG